ncbi:murein hydrolase activator EnvC family protein [Iningainema tapete]|uniref:Peptidoglycan DD-metalloendopeptidase family protein n=1 Tax=Iningainema tapete BLCC-T55 TaxID=2748662 RepID=A0A8J7C4X8_9CYAN|nr:M23 family metallopeptidase [Iningainema tapete]MBD2772244.1 peptidoglycan DD-metalloendopeptidase family protein [Iningainema tapete BLCC-T55]
MRALFFPKPSKYLCLQLVFCCILCVWILFFFIPVDAEPPLCPPRERGGCKGGLIAQSKEIDTLQKQQKQINQQRTGVIEERNRLSNIQQVAQDRLNGLQQNLQITDNNILDSNLRLQLATERHKQLSASLAVALQAYVQHQAATIARLRFLQRSHTNQGWAVLLQSQNLSDFLDRRRQLQLVYQADQQVLVKLGQQANRIDKQKIAVEEQKNEIDLIRGQLLAQKADYQAQSQLQDELIQRLNSDRLALDAAQSQLERDSQAIGILIQKKVAQAKANSAKGIFIRGTGILAYPTDAPASSAFGWRVHPILGYSRFHTGLDFAASYGSTIRAADSGTVIFAGWYGGYGKAVIIDHGKGITTLYGHTSELLVGEGQTVQRGSAIASVGSTGLSTGPHLHFEVRRDGTPVDPANFL